MDTEILQSNDLSQIINEVSRHPFEFGFRYPVKNGSASFSLSDKKEWKLNLPEVRVTDTIWFGSCVEDAKLTAAYLRSRVSRETAVTIQKLDAYGIGNSPLRTDHYRVLVEDPTRGVITNIDHSEFHKQYLGPGNTNIRYWRDMKRDSERKIRSSTDKARDIPVNGITYCEFDLRNTKGLSILTIENNGQQTIKIIIDLIMPGLPKGKTDKSVSFPVYFSQLSNKQVLYDIINGPFYNETEAAEDDSTEIIPRELKPLIKEWFREIIKALPNSG